MHFAILNMIYSNKLTFKISAYIFYIDLLNPLSSNIF